MMFLLEYCSISLVGTYFEDCMTASLHRGMDYIPSRWLERPVVDGKQLLAIPFGRATCGRWEEQRVVDG
eukprot:5884532-Amphidinium_carterae.1